MVGARLVPSLLKGFKDRASKVGKDLSSRTESFRGFGNEVLVGDRSLKDTIKKHPFLSGLGIAGAAGLAGEAGRTLRAGARESFTGKSITDTMDKFERDQAFQQRQMAQQAQYDMVQQELARNAARLAAANPHLYNQIMAGRRLPQGAVILGGNPRTDLMEEIAGGMASQQQMQQPGPMMGPQDQFLNELGV